MSRETLKNFLNLKGFSTDNISLGYDKPTPAGRESQHDLGEDLETGEKLIDFANEGVGLLGDYLNFITQNKNVFMIEPGNEEAATSNRGDSLALAEEQGADEVFVGQGGDAASQLSQFSNSQYFDAAGSQLNDLIDKTSKDSDNHRLLSDIEGKNLSTSGETLTNTEGEDNKVTKAVSNVLLRNNRFANVPTSGGFATKGSNQDNFESGETVGSMAAQRTFGKFNPNDSRFSLDELKKIGHSLLYKASGYDPGEQPGSSVDGDIINDQILSEDIKDSLVDENSAAGYHKLDFRSMRAKYAKGAPEDAAGDSMRDNRDEFLPVDPEANSSKTFGTSYNPTVHFSGRGRKIVKFKAAIACLALKKISKDFMTSMTEFLKVKELEGNQSTSEEFVTKDRSYEGPGPYPLGAYRQMNSFQLDAFKKIVLTKTDYPYTDCFEKGLEVFFGADEGVEEMRSYDHISQAPGYWLSIANSILKSFDQLSGALSGVESFTSEETDTVSSLLEVVRSSKLIMFANAAATVGDIFFKTYRGKRTASRDASNRSFDVDSLPTGPGSRVGKSRDTGSESPLSLAWRQGSVPSMYILPKNVVKATVELNNILDGVSPVRGMTTSVLVKNTYLDENHDGSYNKIPDDVVRRLENRLEAEYVPFYIQDLRTNEVISFHAFLSNLTDNIKADFSSVAGYGRLDPVQTYKSTTRTIGVQFILYATSKEDFDSMWYKINKLVTLLYPQWTQGEQLSTVGTDRFIQPFSQVIGASPIVRLRVGDVIKSNYSRFNLARMFGIGDQGINPTVDPPGKKEAQNAGNNTAVEAADGVKKAQASESNFMSSWSDALMKVYYAAMGTPLQYIPTSIEGNSNSRGANLALSGVRSLLSNALINGFVNPVGAGLVLRNLIDPNARSITAPRAFFSLASLAEEAGSFLINTAADNSTGRNFLGYHAPQRVFIKASMNKGYKVLDDGTSVRITRPLRAMVTHTVNAVEPEDVTGANNLYVKSDNFKKSETSDNLPQRSRYHVLVIDPAAPSDIFGKKIEVDHQYLMPDPMTLFATTTGALLAIAQPLSLLDGVVQYASDFAAATGAGTEAAELLKGLWDVQASKFMYPENNPFTRALESTAGRGLAGVLDGIQFNWLNQDFTWETDYNSRAPRGCEISFNLSVIHDLPPGLDHSGYNRAPLYNVGSVMQEVVGDARGDDLGAEFEYRRAGNSTFSKE